MSAFKAGIMTTLSAIGLFAAAPAHADEYYGYRATIVHPIRFYTPFWHRGRWARRPIYAPPVYRYAPAYSYDQPVYQEPSYANGYGYDGFAEHVRAELAYIEAAVRDRVAAGQLDGNALTAMESARDDINQDLSDLSAKGYFTDADRAHVENDVRMLRQKFGC
jgi:hypothetical protein